MDRTELQERIADGAGADLSGVDLSGQDLRDLDLSKLNLSNANLSRADLTRARLDGTKLEGANLSHAVLRDAYVGASVKGADLRHVDLTGATVSFTFVADMNNARADFAGATLPDGAIYQHPSTGAESWGLAQLREQGRRNLAADQAAKVADHSTVAALGSALPKPRNAILGWFVIATLVLALLDALSYGFAENPLVPVVCAILVLGLLVKRIRRGAFGRGWFLATTVIGFVITFGAIGAGANNTTGGGGAVGGGVLLIVPAVLALIAVIRGRVAKH